MLKPTSRHLINFFHRYSTSPLASQYLCFTVKIIRPIIPRLYRHLTTMPPKRKLATTFTSPSSDPRPQKKLQTTLQFAAKLQTQADAISPITTIEVTETSNYDEGVVDRKYYPPVLSNARCAAYSSGELPKPIDELNLALSSTGGFRSRVLPDALHLASKQATTATGDCAVIGLYVFSPQDFEAHVVSPARVDFILQCLKLLREDLAKLDIPLCVEVVGKRKDIPARVMQLAEQWGAKHVFANIEYEVDELRRDVKVVRLGETNGVAVNVVHDTCVIAPGQLLTKVFSPPLQNLYSLMEPKSTGKAFSVYTPWFRAYLAHLSQNPSLLNVYPPPSANHTSTRTTFSTLFVSDLRHHQTVRSLFPAGSHEGLSRLFRFLDQKASAYATDRNIPSKPGTSVLSPHFSAGTLSARTAISHARAKNNNKLSGRQEGLNTWISEVAWRDFYKHVLCAFPYICMNKPFKPSYSSITWCPPPLSSSRFTLWTLGQTGYPIIDAAMRQLSSQKFLPNRLRMVVASFLCKDLHVDWRLGERYFSSQLIDGDFASNNGGWGFSSSTGVDPQPYFRVFNPKTQSERFDPEGVYIKTWVEELRGVRGGEIHAPSVETRRKTGYPREIVVHDVQRKEAVAMYKEGIERGKKD
ncbi:putative deoxyribodipyrimidine photo-lyase Phr1 [Trichophaea hybrida]|nr:putative deoxyribodipyrimidine photo-lyase Phr1 [Trichophaea hybrida]